METSKVSPDRGGKTFISNKWIYKNLLDLSTIFDNEVKTPVH